MDCECDYLDQLQTDTFSLNAGVYFMLLTLPPLNVWLLEWPPRSCPNIMPVEKRNAFTPMDIFRGHILLRYHYYVLYDHIELLPSHEKCLPADWLRGLAQAVTALLHSCHCKHQRVTADWQAVELSGSLVGKYRCIDAGACLTQQTCSITLLYSLL